MHSDERNRIKKPSFAYALFMLLIVIAIISVGILVFDAPIQMLMLISMLALIPLMMGLGFNYKQVEKSMIKSMSRSLQPTLILLTVGILIGAWIASGTLPTLVYYGIEVISPQFFLLTALIFCSIISLAIGTSWGTMGTAGIALMGIGEALGVPAAITAGAVISGAFFGDKMSPLSDTTNLTPAVTGGELFTHIKHMLWTTVPAYIISAIIFTVIGLQYKPSSVNTESVNQLQGYLVNHFNLGLVSLIPIVVLVTLLVLKKPALPSIFIASVSGGLVAVLFQGFTFSETLGFFYDGYTIESGIEMVDSLLIRGGLTSMLSLIVLFLFALGIGGMLADARVLEVLISSFATKIKSTGVLVFVTILVCYATLAIGGAIYFSIVMSATMMRPIYERFNLRPENLSRVIEDASTQGGALVPWTAAGIFAASTLGVPAIEYLPYCFLALITPMFSLFYGITGLTMKKNEEELKPNRKIPANNSGNKKLGKIIATKYVNE